jgi:hypothetical protein
LFLALKGLSAPAVYNELAAVRGANAIVCSIVTNYRRQRQFSSIFIDSPAPEEPATIVTDQAILDALGHYPSSSIRELARFTCIPTTTIHQHLMQSFGFLVKHLRWVPNTLTPTQKRSLPLSQLSSYASFGPSNTTVGSLLSPLTSHSRIFRQTMSRSGFT